MIRGLLSLMGTIFWSGCLICILLLGAIVHYVFVISDKNKKDNEG
jgi:hypothetical protein